MKKKSLLDKNIYELKGQISMFDYDNLIFKTIDLFKRQLFDNIYINCKLKKIIKGVNLILLIIYINN